MKIYYHSGFKNIIGKRVKDARRNSKPILSQSELAAKLNIMGYNFCRTAISKIESGDRLVADYEVVAIAQALKVQVEWLLLGSKTESK